MRTLACGVADGPWLVVLGFVVADFSPVFVCDTSLAAPAELVNIPDAAVPPPPGLFGYSNNKKIIY